MRIDAHQHYWRIDRTDYGWLTPEAGILYRNYLPEHLKPYLETSKINHTIVVQAAPTVDETEYLLDLADNEPSIVAVVGWLDLESKRFPEMLAQLRKRPKFAGIRPMLQDLEDDYILRPAVLESLKKLEQQQFPIDLLIKPAQLPFVVKALESVPALRAVVDHLAKPNIAEGVLEPWGEQLERLAQFSNVYCKLSGMVTEAVHKQWSTEQFIPFIHHAVRSFGVERIMFGSDWPVCLLSADYAETVTLLERTLPGWMGEHELQLVFGKNAAAFYRLAI